MTNHQINIAIAEACGWTECEHVESLGLCKGKHENALPQYPTGHSQLPDYCNDLNAMHEAEEVFSTWRFWDYADILNRLVPNDMGKDSYIRASARQRAEAFVKTLGKWEEQP